MKRFLVVCVCAFFLGSVQGLAKELRKVTFKVMQMECPNCEKKVKKNISFEKGLKKLDTDVPHRTVTITYDAEKTSVEKLKEGFRKFSYEAKVISDVKLEK